MNNKLFVAGLSFSVTDETLAEMFAPSGTVSSAKVVMDRETGRSRGFGFVEMSSDAEAAEAIKNLDGTSVGGRSLVVNVAKPNGGGGGGRPGGGGGNRNGGGGGFGGGRRDRY